MSSPPPTRRRFGRYETLFRFATGGMAEVFVARATGAAGFERLVALKRILPNMIHDERIADMFMDEGRLAANVTSSHVVSTLDLGRADDGSLYIVMDLVIGAPLSRLMSRAVDAKKGDPSPAVATEIIRQAARGLHDAHEATTPTGDPLNLIHRDISPQNILVGSDGRVQITDFGIARAEQRKTQTSTGEFKGKITYFSPEQTANRALDRRCDIFALGIVAWEVLTGRRLFGAENPLAVLDQIMNMPIEPPHDVRPQVPREVSAVVMKALARDPDERYQTAAELEDALREAALTSLPSCSRGDLCRFVSTYGGESLERIQAQIKRALEHPEDELEAAPAPRRRSGWAVKAGLVALVMTIAVALAVAMEPSESAPAPGAASDSSAQARADAAQSQAAQALAAQAHAAQALEAPAAQAPAAESHAAEPPVLDAPDAPDALAPARPARASIPPRRAHAPRRRAARLRAEPREAPAPVAPVVQAPAEPRPEPPEPRLGTNRAPILR